MTTDRTSSETATRGQRLRSALPWAVIGAVATLLGTATGHLVNSLLSRTASPVLEVSQVIVDVGSGFETLKQNVIDALGTADKPVTVGSVLVVVTLLGAVSGVLARRRLAAGIALQAVLVAVAAAAVLVGSPFDVRDTVPSLVTFLVGAGALWFLGTRLAASEGSSTPAESGTTTGASRRGVLIGAGVMALAAAAFTGVGRFVTSLRASPSDVTLPAPDDAAGSFPDGLDDRVDGITRLRTPNSEFYRVDTRLDTPVVDLESWTLTIDGDVEEELELTFDDLLEMELIERDITMTCVSNSVGGEFVGGARWLGVRLTDILERAGVGSTADQILATDFDGMTISTPLDVATDGRDTMIAIGMNGEALPRAHGFPARMITPGLYGFVGACKWITRITLTTYDEEQAYWTERDWATDAPIKISARIDTPSALEQVAPGTVTVGGVAWAQQKGGVARVQVRIDGGPWQDAELGPDVGNDYWRQWFYEWDASGADSGTHSVAARVMSGDGTTQTDVRASPFPEGASGVQTLQVTVTDG